MDFTDLWKFGHIAAMFAAVSIFVGQGMLEGAVARSGDVRALRRVLAAEDRFAPIGGAILLLGVVEPCGPTIAFASEPYFFVIHVPPTGGTQEMVTAVASGVLAKLSE